MKAIISGSGKVKINCCESSKVICVSLWFGYKHRLLEQQHNIPLQDKFFFPLYFSQEIAEELSFKAQIIMVKLQQQQKQQHF